MPGIWPPPFLHPQSTNKPKPATDPNAPPPMRALRCAIGPVDGIPKGTLIIDAQGVTAQVLSATWIPEGPGTGILDYVLPQDWPLPFGATQVVTCDEYAEYRHHFRLADFNAIVPEPWNKNLRIQRYENTEPRVVLAKKNVLRGLVIDGDVLAETAPTARWTDVSCTDFRVLQRFLAGEDIRPLLIQRQLIGFNGLRVFLMCDLMFHLHPQEFADYLPRLRAFCELVATFALRMELTVLVDATRVMPELGSQQRFFADVCATVRGLPYVRLELVNENDQTINAVNTDAFEKPTGILCGRGSKGVVDTAQQPACVTPVWDIGYVHPARDAAWPRYGHNAKDDVFDALHVPGFVNESCRPDQGRGPVPSDFFDGAANIALMCAGGTFHSQQLKDSLMLSGQELACAHAWVAGARAVPLEFQHGEYAAPHLVSPRFPLNWSEGDSARAHARIVGDRACVSLPQMRDGYVPTSVDGWRIASRNGSVVVLERA